MSSNIFGVFGSITGMGIAWVLLMKIPHCLNCGVSYPNNVTRCLWQWKYSQLLNGSIINIIFTVMFENKDLRTKHRHGKLFCHRGICWDMEGMLEPVLRVWLISQVDRRYILWLTWLLHSGGNVLIYVHVILTKSSGFSNTQRTWGQVQPRLLIKERHPWTGMWSMYGKNLLSSKICGHPDVKHFTEDN